jgi:hypothetical protein
MTAMQSRDERDSILTVSATAAFDQLTPSDQARIMRLTKQLADGITGRPALSRPSLLQVIAAIGMKECENE